MNNKNTVTRITEEEFRWPEGAIVYQIYPRSYLDTNKDGIGDLNGIISKLDYLVQLGVNAIWLSPFYPSPMADFGYDIADYCDVHPDFGTLDDFDELQRQAEKHDIKLIIDLVPNHTSDEHNWFKQSRKSKDNPYSDWYIWRDAVINEAGDRQPPNNWLDALTGSSAWHWDEARQQYYLHSFHQKQPDLNWSNQAVRDAIKDVMRFWLNRGVNGFRVDAVYWMAKEPLLSDDPPNPDYVEGEDLKYDALLHTNSQGWPVLYAYLNELSEVLKEAKYAEQQPFMVTEAYPQRHNLLAEYMSFYVGMDPLVAAPFNFEGISLPWEAGSWRRFLRSFHHALNSFSSHCVPSYAFGNHDQPRLVSRIGEMAARSATLMQLTLPGMIFIYYGEEIGMQDSFIPPEHVQDPAAKGDPKSGRGRDPQRTPMQWTAEDQAGFSQSENTWLPISPLYKSYNVADEVSDSTSFYNLYKTLCHLRNQSHTLKYGSIKVLEMHNSEVLGYLRTSDRDKSYIVVINFSTKPALCDPGVALGKLIVSSVPQSKLTEVEASEFVLAAHEAALFEIA